jgi:type VI secretion system protein ImpK
MTKKLNQVIESANELLSLVGQFRQADFRHQLIADDFQVLVRSQFDLFERKLSQKNITPENLRLAKYCLAAFFDELVMTSDWAGRLTWMSRTLQWLYFGEHAAGEGFFAKLAEIRQQGIEKLDLLELYYLCLQLGFEGQYRVQHPERLTMLANEIKNKISHYRAIDSQELTPEANKILSFVTASQQIPYWTIVAIVAALMVVIYLGFMIAIHSIASSSADELVQYASSIKTLAAEQHEGNENVA